MNREITLNVSVYKVFTVLVSRVSQVAVISSYKVSSTTGHDQGSVTVTESDTQHKDANVIRSAQDSSVNVVELSSRSYYGAAPSKLRRLNKKKTTVLAD